MTSESEIDGLRNHAAPRVAAAVVLILALVCRDVDAAAPAEVDNAIDRGVRNLYSRQRNGNWESGAKQLGKGDHASVTGRQWGGRTAIVTYALLAAGESPQNPRIKSAVDFLIKADIEGTYALGMRAQVWGFLPKTAEVRTAIARDAQILMKFLKTEGEATGLYSYYDDGGRYDHSCSNYGVLGLWALLQNNWEIPAPAWVAIDTAWRRHQQQDGGWTYINSKDSRSSLSMTSAAVATLFITRDVLYANQGVECKGNIVDPSIERGLEWMGQHLMDFEDGGWKYYTLYNIERVGVAGGHKYIGTTDWYKVGADYLVKHQEANGSWGDLQNTCWAILFLVRGRAPVMINKLEYTIDRRGDNPRPPCWNERPRDVANITRWTSRQIERNLNWQIVNLRVDVRELHDAPILFIAGKDALVFTPEEENKLRDFVEQGGLIIGNADCANTVFANSFKRLGTRLFGGEFRDLPADHCIYTNQQYMRTKWRTQPVIMGLSNGVRELMLLYPGSDPARYWQTQSFLGPEREALSQSIANIFLYTISKRDLRFKGQTYIVRRSNSAQATKTVGIARLEYPGNWDPEPGGWKRLGNVLHNQHKTDLKVQSVRLGAGKLDSAFAAAHLTGAGKVTLAQPAIDELKQFVEKGGTLIIDSAGGDPNFATSAEAMLKSAFAASALSDVNPGHELYRTGNKIEAVEYRAFARRLLGSNPSAPRLRGIEIAGRLAVIFSGEDLSAGLVGNPVDGVNGYAPLAAKGSDGELRAGATEIMSNILLYAAKHSPSGVTPIKPPARKPQK